MNIGSNQRQLAWSSRGGISPKAIGWLPHILLGASLLLNVYQQRRIDAGAAPVSAKVKEGDLFPELTASELSGKSTHLSWKSSPTPTVVYVFRPTCVWCARNLENIRTLASAKGNSYRFLGISLTSQGLLDYQKKANLPFPVYSIDLKAALGAKLSGTPEMILISRNGSVQRDFAGALSSKRQTDAEKLFGLRLPGLITSDNLP